MDEIGGGRFDKVRGAFFEALHHKQLAKAREEGAQRCHQLQEKLDHTEKELRGKILALAKENGGLYKKEAEMKKDLTKGRSRNIELEKELKALKNSIQTRIDGGLEKAWDEISKYKESIEKCRYQTQQSLKLVQTVVFELQRQEAENRALQAEVKALRSTNISNDKKDRKTSASARLRSEFQQLKEETEALQRELQGGDASGNTKKASHADDAPREFLSPPKPVSPTVRKSPPTFTTPTSTSSSSDNNTPTIPNAQGLGPPVPSEKAIADPGARRLAAARIRQSPVPEEAESIFPVHPPRPGSGPRSPRAVQLATRIDIDAKSVPETAGVELRLASSIC